MRLRLLTKFTLVISVTILTAMVMFTLVSIGSLKRVFLEEAVRDVDNLSETLIQTTYYQMLEDDRKRVYQMIDEVGTQKGVEHIRLINKDGIVTFSTEAIETGTILDKNAEACNMCHAGTVPLTEASSMSRSRIFRDRSGKQVLGVAKGIYGDTLCLTADCHFHEPEAKLLGVLDVTVSLEEMSAQMVSYRNGIVFFTFSLLTILVLSLAALTQRVINRPVKELLRHTKKLAAGDLESRVKKTSGDEMGELAESFNIMALNLRNAQNELKEWGSTLEAKVQERTQEIQHMQAELYQSEKLAALGEMSAGIAHEVNNPLTGILMYGSMLYSDPRLDPDLKDDLAVILSETKRCGGIVRGLLEFSRKSVPQKLMTSISQLMDKTLALVEHQALFFNIRVVRNYDPLQPEVFLDPNQLEQVFINLIFNAAQAMPEGGTLTIETGVSDADSLVWVKIRDTGCGIAPEHLERIFNPFFTTKGVHGTGLGLSVSYGVVESHGGQIEVESAPGEGSTFIITLPLMPSDQEAVVPGDTDCGSAI
jgi:two-component system, NtrC family, sensor kinase